MPRGERKKNEEAPPKPDDEEGYVGVSALQKIDVMHPSIQKAPPSKEPWQFKPFPGRKEITRSDLHIMYYIRNMNKRIPYYYRDRIGTVRGPATMPIMQEAWINGLIDENTLVWGQGQVDFLPIKNIRFLTGRIRTPEVQLCTFFKKHLVLKPALSRVRKDRQRPQQHLSPQVVRMF